jgi:hypothetical protein
MHPQASEKRLGVLPVPRFQPHASLLISLLACKGFFEALEACHEDGWKKFFGGCNEHKRKLNSCLHGEVSRCVLTFVSYSLVRHLDA